MLSRLILLSLLALLASACATTATKRAPLGAAEKQTLTEIDEKGPTRNPATAIPVIGPLTGIGADAEYRSYDPEEEYAADRYALDLLVRPPGNPPTCLTLVTLLERLQDQGGTRVKANELEWRIRQGSTQATIRPIPLRRCFASCRSFSVQMGKTNEAVRLLEKVKRIESRAARPRYHPG